MFPKTIRPGIDTEVYVSILNATDAVSVTVTLQDEKNNTVLSANKDIISGKPDTVQLQVGDKLCYFNSSCIN